jgi:hypothetical protein
MSARDAVGHGENGGAQKRHHGQDLGTGRRQGPAHSPARPLHMGAQAAKRKGARWQLAEAPLIPIFPPAGAMR